MTIIQNIFLFIFSLISLFGFSQQKKYIYFDELWQISTSKHAKYFECECYILESGAYEGPFNCFNIQSDVKVKSYNFINNILDGEVSEYYENGNKKLLAYYKKGLPIKEWKEWNEAGELVVDKKFDDSGRILKDKKKNVTDYEKMYFGSKEFESPIYTTKCIMKSFEKEKYKCSDTAMIEYYKHPPLPPYYFSNPTFSGNQFVVKLKYLISRKGKVTKVILVETSGDAFLDDLAETHVLNMIPFESAKNYENPIDFWVAADIIFKF